METDKHYFTVGFFIIGLMVGAAFFSLWLVNAGHHDDILYQARFSDSISGLAIGDPVKFHGVDVGKVEAMRIDGADPRQVVVDLRLGKKTPVKTDTRADLRLKGITGVVIVDLSGGDPGAPSLLSVTPKGQVPEIPTENNGLGAVMDQLPKIIDKFSEIEDQIKKLLSDKNINMTGDTIAELRKAAQHIDELTASLKSDPSQLLNPTKKDSKER